MRPNFNSSSKPKLACEITADRVLAARVSEHGDMVETCTAGELAPGSVVPDLMETNLRERKRVFDTVQDTLSSLNSRSRDVIAVLPDAAVRVMLLDFETLPANPTEAESVVRFRLRNRSRLISTKLRFRTTRRPPQVGSKSSRRSPSPA